MARNFAGTQYLQVDTPAITQLPFSISLWFNAGDVTNFHFPFHCPDKDSTQPHTRIDVRGDIGGDPVRFFSIDSGFVDTTTGYLADVWDHVLAVCTSTTLSEVWLNAGSKGTETGSLSDTTGAHDRTAIGRTGDSTPTESTDVDVAEVGVWNGFALGQKEADILVAGFSPKFVRPDALTSYWHIFGNGNSESDHIGNINLKNTSSTKVAHPRIIYPVSPAIITAPVAAVGANPKGPLGHPLWGPLAGPVAA